MQPAVGIEFGIQNPSIRVVAVTAMGLQHDGSRAIAEQDAGRAVFPVEQPAHRLGTNDEDGLRLAGLDEIVCDRHPVDEAGAHGLNVEGCTAFHAQARLQSRGRCRKGFVGRGRGHDDQVEIVGVDLGVMQRVACGLQREVGCHLALGDDVALLDSGAFANPFVAGVDALGEFGVGEDGARQKRPAAHDVRADHEAAASGSTG
jgi:hypothetical protein